MQYAKKVALVPQHYLEDREYKRIQRPGPAVARTGLSLDIKRILDDNSENDHQKVKRYVSALQRYVNVRDQLPDSPEVQSNPIRTPLKLGKGKRKRTRHRRQLNGWKQY